MTPEEVLERARLVPMHAINPTLHCRQRMVQRRVQPRDIEHAMRSATVARPDDAPEKWRLEGGTDLDGDDLIVVVVFGGNDATIVSIF